MVPESVIGFADSGTLCYIGELVHRGVLSKRQQIASFIYPFTRAVRVFLVHTDAAAAMRILHCSAGVDFC